MFVPFSPIPFLQYCTHAYRLESGSYSKELEHTGSYQTVLLFE
jgi:hypothetical protein